MSRGLLVAWLSLQAGCSALTGFSCLDDSQCRSKGRTGSCESGYCAYPDGSCSSGLRWSEAAAEDFADRCVDAVDATSTEPDETASETTTTTDIGGESSSTTMEPPVPFCGDGIVDPDEECDPGDQAPDAPMCNTSCTISGRLTEQFSWPNPGDDSAYGVIPWDGDIAVVGFISWEGEGRDLHVARHAPDGMLRWRHQETGTAHKNDYGRALALTSEGNLRVVGDVTPDEGKISASQGWLAELDANGIPIWEVEVGTAAIADVPLGLALEDDNEFVTVGRSGAESDFSVHRYAMLDGEPALLWEDTVAGGEGEIDLAWAVALRLDGLIFAGGYLRTVDDRDRWLSWWTPLGKPAPEPCDAGGASRATDAVQEIRGLAIRPDGSIAAAGISQPGISQDAWVAVYDSDCKPVWQRSVGGTADAGDAAVAVAVDEEGNIFTGGWKRDGTDDDTWLAKWDGEGEGVVVWEASENGSASGNDRIHAIAIDYDNTLVVAGQTSEFDGTDIWVARYTP